MMRPRNSENEKNLSSLGLKMELITLNHTPFAIDIGSIGCEEDAGMNLQDSEREWEKQNPAIIEEEREIRQKGTNLGVDF